MTTNRRRALLAFVIAFIALLDSSFAQPQHYWVYFNNRAVTNATPQALGISDRALKRRSKVLPTDKLVDERDYPVSEEYVQQLRAQGATIRAVSRWFNAVSVEIPAGQVKALTVLPFVSSIAPVATITAPRPQPAPIPATRLLPKSQRTTILNYGSSFTQLDNEHITDLHATGIIGSGVVVGMIDDGFSNHRVHPALKNIRVLAEHDFIHNITDTQTQPWEVSGQGNHGAGTLSSVAGFDSGKLIGGAFGVSVLLAKTEMDSSGGADFHSEEDTYVAGLEWMEQMGADVASSSLAYKDFNAPPSYTYQNLDGKTTLVAKAARIAASKGMLLCTATGNEGSTSRDSTGALVYAPGTLWSPADADSILAVGATLPTRALAGFSGTGPTSDGRTKPDVVAQGTSIYWADGTATGYYSVGGTSCSTPLVASVAALVFSAHPEWTPMQVREAIIQTTVHVSDGTSQTLTYPNNFYGYGFVNALDAVLYAGPVFSNRPIVMAVDTAFSVTVWIRSKSNLVPDSLALYYKRKSDTNFKRILLSQSLDANHPFEFSARISKSAQGDSLVGYFTAFDGTSSRRGPYDAPDGLFSLDPTPDSILSIYPSPDITLPPTDYVLYNNFPNPFNPGTTIRFYAPRAEQVELIVINLLGQRIRTLFSGIASAGSNNQFSWNDARDDFGRRISTGAYFLRLKTPNSVLTKKMLFLK